MSIITMGCNQMISPMRSAQVVEEVKHSLIIYEKFSELEPNIFNGSDTIYVVNFWATSCPPCIKEMPYFNQLEKNTRQQPIKIFLVSLDLIKDTETRVRPFINKYKILPQVIHLRDDYYSMWIDKIDPTWYGALPATLIVQGDKRHFTFDAFESYEDLLKALHKIKQS